MSTATKRRKLSSVYHKAYETARPTRGAVEACKIALAAAFPGTKVSITQTAGSVTVTAGGHTVTAPWAGDGAVLVAAGRIVEGAIP